MPIRDYTCNDCGHTRELIIGNPDYPKILPKMCDKCFGDMEYVIGLPGYRRDNTLLE